MNYSKAIFGSSLRNDFDKYSDRDLLIAAEDMSIIRELKPFYKDTNWSVSYYTYSKLRRISSNGGLFIQHLKNESKLILDNEGKLAEILSSFSPKASYNDDIDTCLIYFKYFNYYIDSPILNGWICDVIYVGLRNFLIYNFAQLKRYEFAYPKLLNFFHSVLSQDEILILNELRVIKRNYRDRILDELPDRTYIKEVFRILQKLNIIKGFEEVNTKKFHHIIENYLKSEKINAYTKLRLFEGYYLMQDIHNDEILKIIINPQMYTFNFNDQKYISNLLNKINFNRHPYLIQKENTIHIR